MPVARIITHAPEQTESLTIELRACGYTVEIVSPGDAIAGAADLEITVDAYPIAEALHNAAQLAQTSGADIYVAPGTYRDEQSPAERDWDAVAEHKAMTPDVEPTAELQVQSAFQSPWPGAEGPASSSVVDEHAPAGLNCDAVAEHRAMTSDLEPTMEIRPEATVQPPRRAEAETEKSSVVRDAVVAFGGATTDVARSCRTALVGVARRAASVPSAFGLRFSQWRSAWRGQRERSHQQYRFHQEQQSRDKEAQTGAAHPAPNRVPPSRAAGLWPQTRALRNTAVVLGHKAADSIGYVGEGMFAVVRRLSQWRVARQQRTLARRQAQAFPGQVRAGASVTAPPVRKGMFRSRASDRLPVIRRTRERDDDWAVAAIFSSVLAIGVMVAWAAASRQPASPLPPAVLLKSNSIEQQVPFGPVKLSPPQVAGNSPAQVVGKTTASPRHPVPPSTAGKTRYLDDREVVVRHFAPAHARPAQVRSSVKRYTDAEY